MFAQFFKSEINNLACEMTRIVDKAEELSKLEFQEPEWPSYCEQYKLPETIFNFKEPSRLLLEYREFKNENNLDNK